MALIVKCKKLSQYAEMPTQARAHDAGYDIKAVTRKHVMKKNYSYIEYGTGLAFEIPPGYVGFVFERSSVSKTNLILANCVGVIDSGFRGEVTFRFKNFGKMEDAYKVGDKIGQLVIMKLPTARFIESDTLSESERGENGYGSSGK